MALTAGLVSATPLDGVRAGSALLRIHDRLLVVGDDAHTVAWVDPRTGSVTTQVLAGDGLPLAKPLKPDFEAAALAPDGSVWILGSGSLSNRWVAVRLPNGDAARSTYADLSGLYAALGSHLGTAPNLEGAVFVGDRLRLCHRATGSDPDVLLDLPASVLHGGPCRVLASRLLDPAAVGGVPAHVTDLALLPDGRTAYLAAAEDTDDPVADGPVAGTVFGVLDGAETRWTPILDLDGTPSTRKAEGLVVDDDARGGWLVTDRDDPSLPAELCRLELSGL